MTDNGHARGNLYNAGMRSRKVNPFKERYWRQFGGGPDETLLRQMDPLRTIGTAHEVPASLLSKTTLPLPRTCGR